MRYEYRCANGHVSTKICPVSLYEEAVSCDECHLVAQRIYTPPLAVSCKQNIGYASPIDGTVITSYQAREEDMKRHGCMEYDPEMKRDHDRRQADSRRDLESAIDETVAQEVAKMPTAQRGKLWSELTEQGYDLQVQRDSV